MVLITVGIAVTEDQLADYIVQLTETGKTYFVYFASQQLLGKVIRLYERNRIAKFYTLVVCWRRVETVQRTDEQTEIVKTYYTGLTNHRGVEESVTQLKRQYYWSKIKKKQ